MTIILTNDSLILSLLVVVGFIGCVYGLRKEGGDIVDLTKEEEEEEEAEYTECDGYIRFEKESSKEVNENVKDYIQMVQRKVPVFVWAATEFSTFDSTSNTTSCCYHQDQVYKFFCDISDGLKETNWRLSKWECLLSTLECLRLDIARLGIAETLRGLFAWECFSWWVPDINKEDEEGEKKDDDGTIAAQVTTVDDATTTAAAAAANTVTPLSAFISNNGDDHEATSATKILTRGRFRENGLLSEDNVKPTDLFSNNNKNTKNSEQPTTELQSQPHRHYSEQQLPASIIDEHRIVQSYSPPGTTSRSSDLIGRGGTTAAHHPDAAAAGNSDNITNKTEDNDKNVYHQEAATNAGVGANEDEDNFNLFDVFDEALAESTEENESGSKSPYTVAALTRFKELPSEDRECLEQGIAVITITGALAAAKKFHDNIVRHAMKYRKQFDAAEKQYNASSHYSIISAESNRCEEGESNSCKEEGCIFFGSDEKGGYCTKCWNRSQQVDADLGPPSLLTSEQKEKEEEEKETTSTSSSSSTTMASIVPSKKRKCHRLPNSERHMRDKTLQQQQHQAQDEEGTGANIASLVQARPMDDGAGTGENADETAEGGSIGKRTRSHKGKKQNARVPIKKKTMTKKKVAPKKKQKKTIPQKLFKDYNSQLTVDSSEDDEGSLWNKNYNRLLKRFKSRGHSVVTELDPDQHLYQWYGQQKEKRTEGKLPLWKVRKLSPIKFCWNEVDKEWDDTCKELMLHHKQNPNSGPPAHLVPWALDLRKAYNDGSITREHEDALQEIDPYFFIRRPISTVPTTSTNSNTDTDFAAAAPTATASIQYGGGLGLMPLRDSNSNNESKEEEEVADDGIPIANDENTDIGEELNNDKVEEGKKGPVSVPPTPIIKKERRRGYTKDVTARPEDYYAAIITFRSPTFKHMSHKAFCESPHSGPNITGSLSHQNSFRRYFGLQKTGKFKNPLGADEGVHVPKVQTPTQTTKDVFDFPGKDNSNTTSARTHRRSLPRRNKRKRDTGSTQRVLRSSKVKKNKNTAVGNAMTKKRKKK